MNTIGKYYHTLRYLRWSQLVGRVISETRRRLGLFPRVKPPAQIHVRLTAQHPWLLHDPWNRRENLLRGNFCFLGRNCDLGWLPDWTASRQTMLWRFNLHYHNYLALLEPAEREQLALQWIEKNPYGEGVGWHPYPTSLRLLNWLKLGLQHPKIQTSLYEQAAYLYRNLETFNPGNHLLENARALVFCGIALENQGEAQRWFQRGCHILLRELPQQVLSDGGYFELTPMYHSLMLELVLDLLNVLPADSPLRRLCSDLAPKMLTFLKCMTHPDGNISLFNDSTQEIAPSLSTLSAYAGGLDISAHQESGEFRASGFYTARHQHSFLVADAGPIGPHHLPGHAHADILSFELTLRGQRLVVDTGVYEYAAGALRDQIRSSAAHNVPLVDGVNQAEVWSSFRVARRYDPKVIHYAARPGGFSLTAIFDGYRHLIGDDITIKRHFEVDLAQDRVEITDDIQGRGRHQVQSLLHLAPDLKAERTAEGILLTGADGRALLTFHAPQVELGESQYYRRFGCKEANIIVSLGGDLELPTRISYKIVHEGDPV